MASSLNELPSLGSSRRPAPAVSNSRGAVTATGAQLRLSPCSCPAPCVEYMYVCMYTRVSKMLLSAVTSFSHDCPPSRLNRRRRGMGKKKSESCLSSSLLSLVASLRLLPSNPRVRARGNSSMYACESVITTMIIIFLSLFLYLLFCPW